MKVQLVKTYDEKKVVYPCLAAIKKDGVRGRYINGKMYSRTGKELLGLSHILNQLKGFLFELDGELLVPGKEFDYSSGQIRNFNETPDVVYYVFDCPSFSGSKIDRNYWINNYLKETENVKLIKHFHIPNKEKLIHFYQSALKQGEEGIVIYNPNSLYENKRNYNWMRMVPKKTADCKVVGFIEGEGKNVGSLGAVQVDYKGHICKVGTGFKEKFSIKDYSNMYVRQHIWDHKELFLGKFVECEFKEETKAGSMRQPVFIRWRFDKS